MIYKRAGCGGTFDHLHAGHKAFLRFAFAHGEAVLIGLTSDTYIASFKKGNTIASYTDRRSALEHFLQAEGFGGRFEIVPIDNSVGPAADPDVFLDVLITTEDTKKGAEKINTTRESEGLLPLPILTMPMIVKNGKQVSSTRVRGGEIDTEGNPYVENDFITHMLLLPISLRGKLQIPFGQLYSREKDIFNTIDPSKSVVIGDATAIAFLARRIYPKISVVDFIIQRKKTYSSLQEEGFLGTENYVSVLNPPGTITPDLWQAITVAVSHIYDLGTYVITIDGEEDLAVLPMILLLPLGFVVYYGQPNKGIVKVVVDNNTKERSKRLLQQFKRA